MANTVVIDNPTTQTPLVLIQVGGAGTQFFMPYISGTLCLDSPSVLQTLRVRCCAPEVAGGACGDYKNASCNMRGQFGSVTVYSWSAGQIPLGNITDLPHGAENIATANLKVVGGGANGDDLASVTFKAFSIGGGSGPPRFPLLAINNEQNAIPLSFVSGDVQKRVYRVRFATGSLPAYFNRLKPLGMVDSTRVKLYRQTHHVWSSVGSFWTLIVNGATAKIFAPIPLVASISITQSWTCLDFNELLGGVFHPNSIDPGNNQPLQPPLVPIDLHVT